MSGSGGTSRRRGGHDAGCAGPCASFHSTPRSGMLDRVARRSQLWIGHVTEPGLFGCEESEELILVLCIILALSPPPFHSPRRSTPTIVQGQSLRTLRASIRWQHINTHHVSINYDQRSRQGGTPTSSLFRQTRSSFHIDAPSLKDGVKNVSNFFRSRISLRCPVLTPSPFPPACCVRAAVFRHRPPAQVSLGTFVTV